ncbi:sigma-70 family RNA polymerase sigma factor [Actinobacteria bacterium YIM 96077]|uniref:RNA polymerase subunit sigma-70 n=1 Tax=Phytoactinopolyspora halophila TaxID=1981511 RepID=A0A329R2Q3_9ACTN|nr:sigma-70 family RNA polymerase sigma factor [Phytoactinopolyspora halophila]AYY11844.1 sigma-70 family RNA polymerase sigma factor [Actinobacteria bacterium YIM 96077]RAW18924.1 RNA polymerase subunit sigma-70 [Phytoactinopolyspora halophila]
MPPPQAAASERDLATAFAAQRPQLRGIAYRMLGSYWDADDAVQEAWLRLQRAKTDEIDNLEAWLTVVISRVSVDLLRSRASRHEDIEADLPDNEPLPSTLGPETSALRADEVGTAMLVVLDTLGPLERLALVLHDVFGLSFDDIAPIVERSPAAARQLASRARRRIRHVDVPAERDRKREAVRAFLKASREGDFGSLLQLLDPEVELHADADVVATAAPAVDHGAPLLQAHVRGADAVARVFAGRAEQTQIALVDGLPGAAYAPDGMPWAVYAIHLPDDRISRIEVIGNPAQLTDLAIVLE